MKAVLKIGGSLLNFPDRLSRLLMEIENIASRYQILIVPGGGTFADEVFKIQQAFALSDDTAHWMAILAQNQFGMVLAERLTSRMTIIEVNEFTNSNNTGLFLLMPFSYLKANDELPHTWDVTSDSIALWIGKETESDFVLLVKIVDGIANPSEETQILSKVESHRLHDIDIRRVVDAYLPQLVPNFSGRLYVVNGFQPNRIASILSGKDTICTEII